MDESRFITAYGGSGSSTSLADIVAYLIGILNSLVLVLGALALLLFMWGVLQYIYKPADKKKYKNMQWGLLTLFVLFSIWGILRLACSSFLGASCSGATTTSCNSADCGPGYYSPGPGGTTPF